MPPRGGFWRQLGVVGGKNAGLVVGGVPPRYGRAAGPKLGCAPPVRGGGSDGGGGGGVLWCRWERGAGWRVAKKGSGE
ncbi:hypothetical protein CCP2SC5_1650001 [Azospirillaceae bacterium]